MDRHCRSAGRQYRPRLARRRRQAGYGRGLLAGGYVLWPTREKIYVFHQQTARLKKEIEFAPLGVRGGNLLVADGRLLIATPSELIVLGINGGRKKEPRAELTKD